MVKEAIATGATVEEAHANACAQLGVDTTEAEFEILELPEKKRFGLFGGNPAKVRAFIRETPADVAAEYLRTILSGMGLKDIQVEIREEEAGAELALTGEDIGFIIGHRGETLDALQYLANLAANKREEDESRDYVHITVDIENYRAKREDTLRRLARGVASKVLRYRKSITLEPMSPYERRIIHSEIQNIRDVTTASIGTDNNRRVVVSLEERHKGPKNDRRRPKEAQTANEKDADANPDSTQE